VVDFWMVGVNKEYSGLGLSKSLTQKALELVKENSSFEYGVMECTGHFSQRMAEQSGFTPVAELYYHEYLKDGKPVFTKVASPHKKWVIYELELLR
jgi:predicted GNAT family N-acyltransferase